MLFQMMTSLDLDLGFIFSSLLGPVLPPNNSSTSPAHAYTHSLSIYFICTFWSSCSIIASCSISFSIIICSCLFLCSLSSSACWQRENTHQAFGSHATWVMNTGMFYTTRGSDWMKRERWFAISPFTLYAFTKRTNTGKNTDGGVVLEFSPKNFTTSSKASWEIDIWKDIREINNN